MAATDFHSKGGEVQSDVWELKAFTNNCDTLLKTPQLAITEWLMNNQRMMAKDRFRWHTPTVRIPPSPPFPIATIRVSE